MTHEFWALGFVVVYQEAILFYFSCFVPRWKFLPFKRLSFILEYLRFYILFFPKKISLIKLINLISLILRHIYAPEF